MKLCKKSWISWFSLKLALFALWAPQNHQYSLCYGVISAPGAILGKITEISWFSWNPPPLSPFWKVISRNLKNHHRAPQGGGDHSCSGGYGQKIEGANSPEHGKFTISWKINSARDGKRKIVNFTHKNTFLVWETRMPPKAYKTNGILMIFAPKTAKMWNFTKIMNFHKILIFLQKVRILWNSPLLPKSALFGVLPPKTINIPGAMEGFSPSARVQAKIQKFHEISHFSPKIRLFAKNHTFHENMRFLGRNAPDAEIAP